jgi:hypothetical protein
MPSRQRRWGEHYGWESGGLRLKYVVINPGLAPEGADEKTLLEAGAVVREMTPEDAEKMRKMKYVVVQKELPKMGERKDLD